MAGRCCLGSASAFAHLQALRIIDAIMADRNWIGQTLDRPSEAAVNCIRKHETAALICFYFLIVEQWRPDEKGLDFRLCCAFAHANTNLFHGMTADLVIKCFSLN